MVPGAMAGMRSREVCPITVIPSNAVQTTILTVIPSDAVRSRAKHRGSRNPFFSVAQ